MAVNAFFQTGVHLAELFLDDEDVEKLHDFEEECVDEFFRAKDNTNLPETLGEKQVGEEKYVNNTKPSLCVSLSANDLWVVTVTSQKCLPLVNFFARMSSMILNSVESSLSVRLRTPSRLVAFTTIWTDSFV